MTPRERNYDQIDRIAFWHGVGVNDVIGHNRRRSPTAARRDCAHYFRAKGKSFPEIGLILQRDHTTVIYLVQGKARKATARLPKRFGYSAGLL
jgi:chromosomal replication initiation ATPase DnaA